MDEEVIVTDEVAEPKKEKRVSRKAVKEAEKFSWAEHVSGLKVTPKEIENALYARGIDTPAALLKHSAVIEDLIREQAVNLKRELLVAAKNHRS